MKINTSRSRSNKKIAAVTLVIFLALAGGYAAYAMSNGAWPFNNDAANKSSDETYVESNTGANTDASIPKSNENPKAPAASSDPISSSSGNTSSQSAKSQIPVSITYIQMNGDIIKVGTNIEKITNTGNCTLSVRNSSGSEVYTEVVGIQALPNSSTCKGFNVPTSQIGSGSYTYNVEVTQKDASGTASKEFAKS